MKQPKHVFKKQQMHFNKAIQQRERDLTVERRNQRQKDVAWQSIAHSAYSRIREWNEACEDTKVNKVKQASKQASKQTNKQTNKQIHKQTNKLTN